MSSETAHAVIVIVVAVSMLWLSIMAGVVILGGGKDQSVECIKAGGQWVPTYSFDGYCERKEH